MPNVTVTDTATKIVSANAKRTGVIIQNAGSNTVYLGADNTVTSAQSIFISANGVFSEDNSGGRMWKGDIYGITTTSTSNVVYWERESS